MYRFLTFILILMTIFLSGCTQLESKIEQDFEPSLNCLTFYQSPVVERSTAPIYVMPLAPAQPPNQPKRAVFFPFYVRAQIDKPKIIGDALGYLFWQVWVGQRVFPAMVYENKFSYPGKKKARMYARQKKADLYILGQVKYLLDGGSQGASSLAIQVDVYSTYSNKLVWSMEHAGRIDNRKDMDFVLFKRKTWMPESPLYVIMAALAHDLAQPVKMWAAGQDFREALKPTY
jgi:hypothetical protein